MGASQDARLREVTVEIMKAQGIAEFAQKVMDLTSARPISLLICRRTFY